MKGVQSVWAAGARQAGSKPPSSLGRWIAARHVEHDGQWGHVIGLDITVDQEAVAVLGNVIGEKIGAGNRCAAMDLEQRCGRPSSEVAGGIDRHGHQHPCRRDRPG